MKTCKECKVTKSLSLFAKGKAYKGGYAPVCNNCHYEKYGRDHHYKKQYGISLETYNEMEKAQEFKCYCCGAHKDEVPRKRLYVDHCHSSGKVRALLCHSCNVSIGFLEENRQRVLSILAYLKEHNG